MHYHIQTLVKHLFDKDSFEQVTVQELKQFTEAYPYAAVGQYLYAKKLYDARSWNYYEQTEQASLYFHNPLWYRWLMDQKHETPVVEQRQEEPVLQNQNGNGYRVVVQMPKGGLGPVTTMPGEPIEEPVEEAIREEHQTTSVAEPEAPQPAAVAEEPIPQTEEIVEINTESTAVPEEMVTHLQEYLPEINTQESIQAETEAFGSVQADGTPPAEYTEAVTEHTEEQHIAESGALSENLEAPAGQEAAQQTIETPVYTEEHEPTLHEFQPATDAEPIQANTEAFGDIQEKDAPETYTETVTHNTEEGFQAQAEETAPAIENVAGIPAAHEEVEATPEFFAEVAAAQEATPPAQEEPTMASAVAIAESSMLAEATEPIAAYQPQDDEVQPGGDLPPYQLLDNTTEIPAAEAREETPGSVASEPAHEGPVNIEFVQDETATETAPAEQLSNEPVQEETVAEHTEPVQQEEPVVQDEPVTEPIAPEAEPYVQKWETEPADNEPVQEEAITEPVTQNIEPVTQEQEPEQMINEPVAQEEQPEQLNNEPETSDVEPVTQEPETVTSETPNAEPETQEPEQVNNEPETHQPEPEIPNVEPVIPEPEIPSPEPVTWKAEPVFTQASTEPKMAINTEEPIFESYHTIDYFASQGIKLGQEDFKDRLGKQLKSFTEWLRSMKRIVPTEASASLDDITNQSIQRIAEHSVEEKEVITEAMAEVWAKQGHPEKAISVYEKLSLLNPAKSPYFAGRIEQLKAL